MSQYFKTTFVIHSGAGLSVDLWNEQWKRVGIDRDLDSQEDKAPIHQLLGYVAYISGWQA